MQHKAKRHNRRELVVRFCQDSAASILGAVGLFGVIYALLCVAGYRF